MKVAVLQQYLQCLSEPLKASGASQKVIADLANAHDALAPFGDRDFADLMEFLGRARTYEAEGHWPEKKSARRAGGAKKPALNDSDLQQLAERLPKATGADLEQELSRLGDAKLDQIRKLMKTLGMSEGAKSKEAGIAKIRAFLAGGSRADAVATPAGAVSEKLQRIIETLRALKAKADGPDAPFDEIESELTSLAAQLDAAEAIQAAKAIGVVKSVSTRDDALQAIRRKVLEVKMARESIAY